MTLIRLSAAAAAILLTQAAAPVPAAAEPANCHMEKQCKWVNFKKICVWTKVCH